MAQCCALARTVQPDDLVLQRLEHPVGVAGDRIDVDLAKMAHRIRKALVLEQIGQLARVLRHATGGSDRVVALQRAAELVADPQQLRFAFALHLDLALWFDASTHLLAKTKRSLSTNPETVSYDDYRYVDGRMLPFSITTTSA